MSFVSFKRFVAVMASTMMAWPLAAAEPPPVIERPTEVFWGSYRRNQDLVDGGASGWSWVRDHLDGFILHGAYWNFPTNTIGSPSPDVVGPKLATLLDDAGGKKVMLEHLLAGLYPDVESAFGAAAAGNPAAAAGFASGVPNIKRLMSYGFPLPEVHTDYIMETWKQSVRMHPEWTSREFFTALTGAWETYDGSQFDPASSDRTTYGWFRQWVEGLATAFPGIRVTCTNSPVYFNWDEGGVNRRELGGDFNNHFAWLKLERRGDEVTALYSGDGTGWAVLGTANVPLGANPLAGLFTASLDGNRLAQARFDNVRVLPFYFADIGKTGTGGSSILSGSTCTLSASGNEFLHPGNNITDALHFAWREWTGDGTFTVRLDSLVSSNSGRTNPAGEIASAGLSIRETAAGNSRQVSLLANFANQLEFLARPNAGSGLAPVAGSGSPLADLGVQSAPRWLRLTRSGNSISAAHSPDGFSWTSIGSTTVSLPAKILVGLTADSQVRSETATAVFTNVGFFTPPAVSFSGSNLGSAGSGATSSVSGSTFTLKARATGLAGTADAGRLHSTTMSGDGTFVARMLYFADDTSPATPLPAGAQMGLTLRADATAGSPQAGIVFTPQLGLRALSRDAFSGNTSEIASYGIGEVSIQPLGSNYRPLLHYFTGNDFMQALHDSFPGAFSDNFAGFTTDSPYAGYQKWGGSETHPDALKHREKIILYERWLQQRGRGHDFIANSAGGTDFIGFDTATQAGRDAWDIQYKAQSLRSIQLHQLEGGRPDRVLFESWYEGPFTLVPENKNGSFANLAMEGIKYIKGTGQSLDLLVKRADEPSFEGAFVYQNAPSGVQRLEWRAASTIDSTSFTVRLVNRGDVAALPVIHAHETGGTEWTVSYQLGGADVSSSIRSDGGLMVTDAPLYSFNELIAPGASVDLIVNIQAATPVEPRDILIRAFWNPQDSSGEVRDSIELVLLPVDSFATGLAGQWPFDGSYDDISGNGRHLLPAGSATLSGLPVKQGSAAMQAGIAGSHAATTTAIPLGDGFSISAWIHLPSGANSVRTIAANSASGFNTNGFRFFANTFNSSDGKLILETGNGTLAANVSSPAGTLAFDRWQHVAATVNRSTGATTLYRNGQPVASGNVRTDFNNDAILNIAAMAGGTNSLRGTIDDLRLHARAIGPEEMSAIAALENSPPTIAGPASFAHPAGSPTDGLPVTIGDAETPASELVLSATSSDSLLLPPSSITLGGTAENRTLVLSPVAWRGGSATITLTVDDGLAATETTFVLTVSNPGYPAWWTAVLPDADLPWSVPAHWDNAVTPWPGAEGELDFLTGIEVPAGIIHAVQDMADPFTARRVMLGGSGPSSGSASLIQQGGGLALVANGTGTPALTLNASGALEHRIEVPVSIAANLNISGDGSGGFEIAGPITGSAGLVKSGSATLTLSGNNSYTGHTNIQQGAIRAAHSNALGTTSSGVTIQGGTARAALELAGGIQTAEPVQLVMQNNADHIQLRNISGDNTLAGQISLNSGGGRWDIAALAGSLTLAGPLANISTGTDTWRTLHLHGPAEGAITGNLTNSASGNSLTNLRVVSGNWTLSGNPKSYTGATTIDGGVLAVQTALASNVTVNANATLTGGGSTTGGLTLQNHARLRTRIADWGAPPAPFSAASLALTGATTVTIVLDGSGIINFAETPLSFAIVAAGAPSSQGNTHFEVSTEDFPGLGTWSAAISGNELRLTYQPDLYAVWTAAIDWQDRDSSPLADPEDDGIPNLLEYALGGDPLMADPGILPQPAISNSRLALSFQRTADPELIYQVEASDDLASGSWTPFWSSTGAANTAGQVTVEDNQVISGHPLRFMRLRVSR